MFYIERIRADGTVDLMMTSPHRVTIDDLEPRNGPPRDNQLLGAFYLNESATPGNLSVFAGRDGWKAQVRWNDTVVEVYDWHPLVPMNPRDPDTDYLWGWKLISENRSAVPFEELHPMSFIG